MNKAIVLNRMYVGDYLMSNLGHEVINLYQADNGGNYLYLNSTGDFVKTHQGKVGYMLMVKYHTQGEVEVIALASDLKDVYSADGKFTGKYAGINDKIWTQQIEYIHKEGGISYGGVSILDIFSSSQQQSIFITYKARNLFIPKRGRRLFIRFHSSEQKEWPKHNDSDVIVMLEGYQQAKASLKQYIYPEGTYKGDLTKSLIEEKKRDYKKIFETLIDDNSLWEESNNKVDEEELLQVSQRKISLFDICQIQNDENRFSNALAYFIERPEYFTLWSGFFRRYGIVFQDIVLVTREESSKIEDDRVDHKKYPSGGRIDLLLRSGNDIVIIENKIMSDINSVEEDGEGKQLQRYFNYVNWRTSLPDCDDFGKTAHHIILTPEYNIPDIEDAEMKAAYKIITYADLYNYLAEHKTCFADDDNFVSFHEAMHRHAHGNVNEYLYYEMQDKFFRTIKSRLSDYE